MVRGVLVALVASAVVAVAGCGGSDDSGASSTAAPAAQVTLPTGTLPAARRAEIDAVAKTILDAGARAGYVGVWEPGKGADTVAVGEAALGRPATVGDNWRIGSITKTFTAVAVLQLVGEGKLALADTVAGVDPDLATRFPPFGWEAYALTDPGTDRTVVLAGNACGIGQQLTDGAETIFPDAVLGAKG